MSSRLDSYINTVSGLGTARDKALATGFQDQGRLDAGTLEVLYEQEAICARIVDRVVDDATREPWSLKGKDSTFDFSEMVSDLESLEATQSVADAWRWARLYGGSLLFVDLRDGTPNHKPVDWSRAKEIRGLHVVESRYAIPDGTTRSLGSNAFGRPSTYRITTAGKDTRIHRSRVIRFDGVRVTPTRLATQSGWGPSVIDRVWRQVVRLGSAEASAESILHEISVMVMRMKGFREKMAGSDEDRAELKEVFKAIGYALSNFNMLVLDTEDDWTEQTRTVSGVDALVQRFVDSLVRVTDMPRTVLLGEQPSGLNASADSEIRAWFDHVASQQQKILTPALTKIISIHLRLMRKAGKAVPEDWTIEYAPLWQPTAKETADTALVEAQRDVAYMQFGVVGPDEVRDRLVETGQLTPSDEDIPLLPETEAGT